MDTTAQPTARKRVVNYSAGLKHLQDAGMEITEAALRSRVRRGTIPHIRRARAATSSIMFDLDELDVWLAGEPAGPAVTKEPT